MQNRNCQTQNDVGKASYFHQNRTWMCLPNLKNLTFSTSTFCTMTHHQHTIFNRKSSNLPKLDPFLQLFAKKYTQFGCHLGFSISNENQLIATQNFMINYPKRQAHYYIVRVNVNSPSCWNKDKAIDKDSKHFHAY